MPLSTRTLMKLLVLWVKNLGVEGYLSLDDVIVEKAFAKRLSWAGWTYSWAKHRKLYGLHIVVLSWCSTDGRFRIPVAFRILRPKAHCARGRYRTKLQLAEQMVKDVLALGLDVDYMAFDTHYTAGWFTKMLNRLGLVWVGTLHPQAKVVFRGQRLRVKELGPTLRLHWRNQLGLLARALCVYAPSYGMLRLVVTNVVLQLLRLTPNESVAAVKERWQLAVEQNGQQPPVPLSACPAHLRATA